MSPRRVAAVLLLGVLLVVQASAEVDSVFVKEEEKYDLEQNVPDLGQPGWIARHLRALGFNLFGTPRTELLPDDVDASQPDSNLQLSARRTLRSSSRNKTPSTSAKKKSPPPQKKKTPSTSAKKKPPPPKKKKSSSSPQKTSPPPKAKKKQSPPPKVKTNSPPKRRQLSSGSKKKPPPPKKTKSLPPKRKSPPPPKKKNPPPPRKKKLPPPRKKKLPPPRQLSSLPTTSSSTRASAGSEKVKVQVVDTVVLDENMPPQRQTLDLGVPGRPVVPARQAVVVPGRVVVHD